MWDADDQNFPAANHLVNKLLSSNQELHIVNASITAPGLCKLLRGKWQEGSYEASQSAVYAVEPIVQAAVTLRTGLERTDQQRLQR